MEEGMNPLLLESAVALADRIRRGAVSSEEVVEAHIGRVGQVNPELNAVVAERFAEARVEARAADLARARGEDRPLLGVPCTIKECFALTGMPNTSGLVARRGLRPDADATAVRRLRAAGAIPLGVTNVSELCMWMETSNRVYGRTNNPYDPSRIVGGSSGGEGAIVGAGASPFGLGSDIGGSIRMPAFFNGVFGHKPTGGLVPGTGQFPQPADGALRYLTTGPITRRAEDLMPLLRLLAGPDREDAGSRAFDLGAPEDVRLEGLSVVSVEDDGGTTPVTPELREAQERAASWLSARGARIRRARIEGLERGIEIWSAMLDAAEGPSFRSMLGRGVDIDVGRELLRWVVRRSPHTLPALGLALVEQLPKRLPGRARRALVEGQALGRRVIEAIGDGVMLYPSYAEAAPRHVTPLFPPTRWAYTAILNVLELPVTQVPLGLSRSGLPLGVQVAATPGRDHVTIAVAIALERAFGGWVPPPRLADRQS